MAMLVLVDNAGSEAARRPGRVADVEVDGSVRGDAPLAGDQAVAQHNRGDHQECAEGQQQTGLECPAGTAGAHGAGHHRAQRQRRKQVAAAPHDGQPEGQPGNEPQPPRPGGIVSLAVQQRDDQP